MKVAKVVAWIGFLAMSAALIYGFTVGNFSEDGGKILANPWGIVSMVDLYVGFILFSGWIIYREKSVLVAAIWVIFMMILGFFTGALYTLVVLYTSQGNWQRFWLGAKAPASTDEQ